MEPQPPAPGNPKTPWHQSFVFIIVSFLIIGPLALPLVWSNKKLSLAVKLVLTCAMALVTLFLLNITTKAVSSLASQLQQLQSTMNQ